MQNTRSIYSLVKHIKRSPVEDVPLQIFDKVVKYEKYSMLSDR